MDLGGERGDHRRRLDFSEDGLVVRGLARAFCPLILTFGGMSVSSGVGQEGRSRSQWIQVAFALLSGAFCAALAALRQDRRRIWALCFACERSHRTLVAAREEAGARVRTRLRSLMNEASIGLSDDDERWADFGCESPAAIRAAKPVRELKSQTKAEKAQERKFEAAIGRAEIAKGKSEKLRVRADKAERDAERLRAEADEAIAFAEGLFAKAYQLKPGSSSAGAESDPSTEASPASRSNEPVAAAPTGVGLEG